MKATLHNMPFTETDTVREFRLEVQIGGEVFHQSVILSKLEVSQNPRISSDIRRHLANRVLDQLKHEIFNQIGQY